LIILGTYVIEMLLVGIGGILIAFYTNSISPANHGSSYEKIVFMGGLVEKRFFSGSGF
jgi:hypothetical protein